MNHFAINYFNKLVLLTILLHLVSVDNTCAQFGLNNSCDGGKLIVPINDTSYCFSGDWELRFEEDFSDTILDMTKWQAYRKGMLGGEAHCSYQTIDNLLIENGIAKLYAKKERVYKRAISYKDSFEIMNDGIQNLRWYDYTSTTLTSVPSFRYGYYEASCRIPKGKGFWPAMWMYGAAGQNNNDPNTISNEIDVFEFWKDDTKNLNMNVHVGENSCLSDKRGVDYSLAFHTYTMIWEPYKIEWYVDGELIRRYTRFFQTGKEVDCRLNAWQCYEEALFPVNPMLIYFDLYIDKMGGYLPDENTHFPSALEVDWVRFYTRTDLADIDFSPELSVNIYPNPGTGLFSVSIFPFAANSNMATLYDIYGKGIISVYLDENITVLDISDKPKGVYYLNIINQETMQTSSHKVFLK
jgi:beta-glucanase (GH16 family)